MLIREKSDGSLRFFSLVNSRGSSYGTVDYREDTGQAAETGGGKEGSTSPFSATPRVGGSSSQSKA